MNVFTVSKYYLKAPRYTILQACRLKDPRYAEYKGTRQLCCSCMVMKNFIQYKELFLFENQTVINNNVVDGHSTDGNIY